MTDASFDIVMPLFNKEAFVAEAVESVLAQSFANWRLFVVDDGSTDRGAGIAGGYDDPRITVIRQSNHGVGLARNAGILAGEAEWIAFLDADDLWNADHLEELDTVRSTFPDAGLIGCAFERFSGRGYPTLTSAGPGRRRLARYFAECARNRELLVTSSGAVRRSALERVGLFEPLPGNEDVELWVRLAVVAPVAVSDRTTVRYRVGTGGITDAGTAARTRTERPLLREQLSSTIPTLTRLLPEIIDEQLRRDVVEYMDSRVGLSLIAAVRAGDIAYARHLLRLYEGVPLGQARTAAMLAKLPQSVGRACVRAGLTLRRRLGRWS